MKVGAQGLPAEGFDVFLERERAARDAGYPRLA